MARTCDICGKGSKKAASRSHSKIKTIRRQYPNLQKVDGQKVCTRCIRTTAKRAAKTTAATIVIA
ncbi:MAG: 50S ribosomal protein L28 [Candidatus Magasanikbacteria bacterium CG_4_9_14_0_2_um_filter_41_10]|uniref:50S ribosomal protein L28 n=1 Tax=Candidatus Magasanikbacteria bacterium CG_4_10_14_0_2_um_filter_41_31 TaxID=1974639 RepID=A0A2M7V575_9BACT|nr:MAG: 50S ribosomal protein L28 [Candidatus Magasanikbacteria bacterium CG_4_10_14_0_2_um_filter_41_31]PJC53726.1 MAG: 50S ribosomal protein L28 [Candidatus Magasanikbacteria bacterium CG_4_9_14_0_2_um_filter_41_10]